MGKSQLSTQKIAPTGGGLNPAESLANIQVQLALDALDRMEQVALTDPKITGRNTFVLAAELKLAFQAVKTGYELHLNGVHFLAFRIFNTARGHINFIGPSSSGRTSEEREAGKLICKAAATLELALKYGPNLKGRHGNLELIPPILNLVARDVLQAADVLGLNNT